MGLKKSKVKLDNWVQAKYLILNFIILEFGEKPALYLVLGFQTPNGMSVLIIKQTDLRKFVPTDADGR